MIASFFLWQQGLLGDLQNMLPVIHRNVSIGAGFGFWFMKPVLLW